MNKKNSSISTTSRLTALLVFIGLLISTDVMSQNSSIHFPSYPIRSFQTNGAVSGITSGDFNGDGLNDIAVAELVTSTVSILLNQTNTEDIFLSSPITYDVGWEPSCIVSGDFDSDGKPDIVTANQGSEDITILQNTSTNEIVNFDLSVGPRLKRLPRSLITVDFNDDGKLDLAVANVWSDTITVLKNVSYLNSIVFDIETEIQVSTRLSETISANDFDGDGKEDLVSIDNLGVVLPNISSQDSIIFDSALTFGWGAGNKFVCGDFDNNGKIDIAKLAFGTGEEVSFIRNNSNPGNFDFDYEWQKQFPVGYGWGDNIHTCDLNNDSLLDLVVTRSLVYFAEPKEHNYISVLINRSSPGNFDFKSFIQLAVAEDPMTITSSDFDNDGKIDLAVGADDAVCISILHNRSSLDTVKLNSASIFPLEFSGGQPSEVNDIPYPCSINGADFNGDNKIDLVLVSWDDNSMTLLRNNSNPGNLNFISEITYPTNEKPNSIVIADFNNDNQQDIVVANGYEVSQINRSLSLYRNISTNDSIRFIPDSLNLDDNPISLDIGDFDSDGNIDIFVGTRSRFPFILKNTSTAENISFEKAWAHELSGSLRMISVAVTDFNFDGKPDIVIGDGASYNLAIFRNESSNGNLNFKFQGELYEDFWGLECISAKDLDGDNLPDLVAAWDDNEGGCSILKNISTQDSVIFSSPITYHPLKHPSSLFICDLTGDQKPDIIVGDPFSQTAILENKCTIGNINFSPAFQGSIVLGDIKGNYNYFVADFDGDGFKDIAAPRSDQHEIWILRTSINPFTSIKYDIISLPSDYRLSQNFPNPFNPSTKINYSILQTSFVTLKVYDVLGKEITTLVNEEKQPGNYNVEFNGSNLASGVYFYRMQARSFSVTKKFILIR